jgi:hypothetical protein
MTSRMQIAVGLATAIAAGALLWYWRSLQQPPSGIAVPPVAQSSAPAASAASMPVPEKQALEVPASPMPLGAEDIPKVLTDFFGRKAAADFLQLDEFPRRLVATVDNLGRDHAPPILWPVNPTADRFLVEERDGSSVIHTDNAARYTPFVLLAETVDIGRAVDLYVRMYPLLQRSYEELGYPGRKFNERLIEVIDLLLATPQASYPVKVELVEVKGPIPSVRPWVRYQYADPKLQSLSAGQKILVRSGAVNQRRLKAKLAELRDELVKRTSKR